MPTYIYHITDLKNLPTILKSGGLLAKNQLQRNRISHVNIAYENIQNKRSRKQVPCSVGGTLHDYVPFYFAPRSPMLYTIHKGNVTEYQSGQTQIVHLVVEVQAIQERGISFAFTDGHPITDYADFFDDLEDLVTIDWKLMESQWWYSTEDDPNRRCRRQAEFLIYQFCPWSLIREIGTMNRNIQARVKQMLQNFDDRTPVEVYSDWYY
ncbi:MAG: DUF4433 domain-containing protein [Spirulina sp.]